MFSNNLLAGVSGQGGAYAIDNSLRFNDNDSAYLSRTPSVAGDRKTWTWSGWVKRGTFDNNFDLISARTSSSSNPLGLLRLYRSTSGYNLNYYARNSSGTDIANYTSDAIFRDVSGWYHIVASLDTTTSTFKAYANGVELSLAVTTAATLNSESAINGIYKHAIGNQSGSTSVYSDGYLAEVNFVDGQALTPDDFGQIDASTGEWSPKAYEGTYGTNGFYLEFKDGAALGDDTSGNTNDWTPTNLASTDQMLDTPTNNFAIYLPDFSSLTLSEGNLETFNNAATWESALSSIGVSSGKWYVEYTPVTVVADRHFVGITSNPNYFKVNNAYLGTTSDSYTYYGKNGNKYNNSNDVGYGAIFTAGDIVGVALDMDAGTVEFFKNNVSQGVAFTGLSGTMFIGSSLYSATSSETGVINFGADSSFAGNKTRQGNTDANGIGDFYYTPPTGYLALCTDNLPAPAIEQPETQFNVVLDTGANIKATAEALYDSSLIWIKDRVNSNNHQLIDTVRGTGVLQSNTTAAETTYSAPSGNSVAWVWKAGGTAVTNTDGTITSQVSANVDAGFSVVSWTSDGSSSNGVGHGLSETPTFFIYKTRNSVAPWYVWTTLIDGSNDQLLLNDTNSKGDIVGYGSPSSTTISNYGFGSGVELIAYCFHSVEGFSKFGSYVGNGSADGPFVYTGFKPAFVMVKRTDSTSNWTIIDNEREGYNVDNDPLYPNLSNAEGTTDLLDILSNGFKCRSTDASINASGGTYIYITFAEHPFNYATGR